MKLVNIYNDSESALIINESSTDLTSVQSFTSLGASPFNTTDVMNEDYLNAANAYFVEMNVYDEDESLLIKLNSAKPLLMRPSTGKFYFGDYHYHPPTNKYMVGKKHIATQHEGLEIIRKNQIVPYPLEAKAIQNDVDEYLKKFAIKTSEVFEILSNIENFTMEVNKKVFIEYGVFSDIFLSIRQGLDETEAGAGVDT